MSAFTWLQVAVLGASGYTGAEITRLLALHPGIAVRSITSERSAGQSFKQVFPHLREDFFQSSSVSSGLDKVMNLTLQKVSDISWDDIDAVFCCLPHGTTQEIIAGLPPGKKVVDLSADFRLRDVDVYAKWYGQVSKKERKKENETK